jgi:hypothetical protein
LALTPKSESLGFKYRKITGTTADAPPIKIAFGSVTPAINNANPAAMNERNQDAPSAFH